MLECRKYLHFKISTVFFFLFPRPSLLFKKIDLLSICACNVVSLRLKSNPEVLQKLSTSARPEIVLVQDCSSFGYLSSLWSSSKSIRTGSWMKAWVETQLFLTRPPWFDLAQNYRDFQTHRQLVVGGSHTWREGSREDGQLSLTLCTGICLDLNLLPVLLIPALLYRFTVCCPPTCFTSQPTQIQKKKILTSNNQLRINLIFLEIYPLRGLVVPNGFLPPAKLHFPNSWHPPPYSVRCVWPSWWPFSPSVSWWLNR